MRGRLKLRGATSTSLAKEGSDVLELGRRVVDGSGWWGASPPTKTKTQEGCALVYPSVRTGTEVFLFSASSGAAEESIV